MSSDRRVRVRLPSDFGRTLEQYGRFKFDPPGSGIDPMSIGGGTLEYQLYTLAQPDPDAFIGAVAAVASREGGWALYGGVQAVVNAVGPCSDHRDNIALVEAATDFLRSQGFGLGSLPPFMLKRRRELDP